MVVPSATEIAQAAERLVHLPDGIRRQQRQALEEGLGEAVSMRLGLPYMPTEGIKTGFELGLETARVRIEQSRELRLKRANPEKIL